MAVVTIMFRTKIDGKYPYLPAVMAKNGRLEPFVAEINGRSRKFDTGTYYLRYSENGKQQYESAGTDPSVAVAKRIEKSGYLDAKSAGLIVSESPSAKQDAIRETVSELVTRYNAEIKANKKHKTAAAYANSLRYFERSCTRTTADQIVRTDMLDFKTFLKNEKLSKRSIYNNFLNAMVFLKWAKIQHGVLKGDWPPKPEREPEEYTELEIEKLLTFAQTEERLVLNCFLCVGLRSGELAHSTYADIDCLHSTWTVRGKENWDTKTDGSQRHIPIPEWLTKKIGERQAKGGRKKSDLIFFNEKGGANLHLLRIVKRVAKRAKMTEIRVDDHKFRSTAISRWLRAGNSVQDVMAWVGHKSLSTILRYAAKINVQKAETNKKATDTFAKFAGMGN